VTLVGVSSDSVFILMLGRYVKKRIRLLRESNKNGWQLRAVSWGELSYHFNEIIYPLTVRVKDVQGIPFRVFALKETDNVLRKINSHECQNVGREGL